MLFRSANPVDVRPMCGVASLLGLLLASLLPESWAIADERELPMVQVPRPIVAGQLSEDFAIGEKASETTYASWNQISEPVAAQLPQRPSDDAWCYPVSNSMPDDRVTIDPISYPEELVNPNWEMPNYSTAQPCVVCPPQAPKPRGRDGFFQQFVFRETYLPGGEISDFGIAGTDVALTVALPFPSRDMPLILTPSFGVHSLDGPTAVDLPSRLFDNALKIQTMFRINDQWGANLAVTPGWYSDFESSNDEALRITGHAFVAWEPSPHAQWVFGIVYLDRQDISLLPVVGLILTPDDSTRIELTFPRPRFAQRFAGTSSCELWWYVAGELGGGTWAIERAGGAEDLVTLTDYRLILGLENKGIRGLKSVLEVGYVFGREIEYESNTPDYSPNDTFLLRAGLTY